jgi:PadR family transcriptional regulator, regulatory protein PadR
MAGTAKRTSDAVTGASSVEQAAAAAGSRPRARGPGSGDPLTGELRRGGLLPALVLHYVAAAPCYGNQLIERIERLSGGVLAVNPNTMYPLLRSLEERGLVAGVWEHPKRRGRRYYRITAAGRAERDRLAAELAPRLDRLAGALDLVRRELYETAA